MTKKFVLGLTMFAVGFLGFVLLIASLAMSFQAPWNGITGVYAGISMMKMQLPVGASLLLAVAGLVLAIREAFSRK